MGSLCGRIRELRRTPRTAGAKTPGQSKGHSPNRVTQPQPSWAITSRKTSGCFRQYQLIPFHLPCFVVTSSYCLRGKDGASGVNPRPRGGRWSPQPPGGETGCARCTPLYSHAPPAMPRPSGRRQRYWCTCRESARRGWMSCDTPARWTPSSLGAFRRKI